MWCLVYILSFGLGAQATQKLSFFITFTPILDLLTRFCALITYLIHFQLLFLKYFIYHLSLLYTYMDMCLHQ